MLCFRVRFLTVAIMLAGTTAIADTAAVLQDTLPGYDPVLTRELADAVQVAGYSVTPVDAEALCQPETFATNRFALLVLSNARTLPVQSIATIQRHLQTGGKLIALGLPAWQAPAFRFEGRWWSRAEYDRAFAARRPEKMIADFQTEDLKAWQRTAYVPESPARIEVVADGERKALHVALANFTGWDTIGHRVERAFASEQTLTCFRAKSGPRTSQLAVEWREQDGSRWIATVNLGRDWQWYVLPPESFQPWELAPGRGGAGDHLRVANVAEFRVGLAMTHTRWNRGRTSTGLLISARPVIHLATPHQRRSMCPTSTVSRPANQFYPVTGPVKLMTPGSESLVSQIKPRPPGDLIALHPRPGGAGFNKERAWRWQPLLEARSTSGDYRGALAALIVNLRPPYRGSVIAAFATEDAAFYRQRAMLRMIRNVAATMRRGVFLQEAERVLHRV